MLMRQVQTVAAEIILLWSFTGTLHFIFMKSGPPFVGRVELRLGHSFQYSLIDRRYGVFD